MSDSVTWFSKLKPGRLAIAALFVFVLLWLMWEEEQSTSNSSAEIPLLKVSTLMAHPQNHRVSIDVLGTTVPRWQVSLVSAVEGRVKQLSPNLEPGELVSEDTLLLEIEPAAYQAALSNAQASVKQAELELARTRHEKTVVEQVSSNRTLSEFGRFIPHLASAQANLTAAKSAVDNTQQRLNETRFTAPFPAIVLERNVVPGQWVNVGEILFVLAASNSIDVHAELSSEQLNKLGPVNQTTKVAVSVQADEIWQAKLRYIAPSFSVQTRQKQLVFYVEQPYSGEHLLSLNATVDVNIKGRELQNVFILPSSVLTPDGQVWVVQNQKLHKEAVSIQQEFNNEVFLRFQHAPGKPREIVRFPLSTMLNGQAVLTQHSASQAKIETTKEVNSQ